MFYFFDFFFFFFFVSGEGSNISACVTINFNQFGRAAEAAASENVRPANTAAGVVSVQVSPRSDTCKLKLH